MTFTSFRPLAPVNSAQAAISFIVNQNHSSGFGSFPSDQEIGKSSKTCMHLGGFRKRLWQLAGAVSSPLAGQHQMRLTAHRSTGDQIAPGVADHRHARQIDTVTLANLLKQARLG